MRILRKVLSAVIIWTMIFGNMPDALAFRPKAAKQTGAKTDEEIAKELRSGGPGGSEATRGADIGVVTKKQHEIIRGVLQELDARNEKFRNHSLEEKLNLQNQNIKIQIVPNLRKRTEEAFFQETGIRGLGIGGHYAIRDGYVYVDADDFRKYGEVFVQHEIDELTALWAFAQEKGWTLEQLVRWLDEDGDIYEVALVLKRIHNNAAKLPREVACDVIENSYSADMIIVGAVLYNLLKFMETNEIDFSIYGEVTDWIKFFENLPHDFEEGPMLRSDPDLVKEVAGMAKALSHHYVSIIDPSAAVDDARVQKGVLAYLERGKTSNEVFRKQMRVVRGAAGGAGEMDEFTQYLDAEKGKGVITEGERNSALLGVRDWLTRRGYPAKLVAKLKQLVADKDWETITLGFYRILPFGTAGKRGQQVDDRGDVLPGPNFINDYTVSEYTLGLARYLVKTGQQGRGVVIGGDTRIKSVLPYRDEVPYAELQAKILRRMGVKIYRFKGPRSIAEVGLAAIKFDAASMEYNSASHNKWQDNGVKASNEFGAQLFPDEREQILEEINKVSPEDIAVLNLEDFNLEKDRQENPDMHIILGGREDSGAVDIDSEYVRVNQGFVTNPQLIRGYSSKVYSLFTPVHGTGIYTIPQVLNDGESFNFNVTLFDAQAYQDEAGRFSTVEKPDPNYVNEKTGSRTLDKAIEEAERLERKGYAPFDFVFGTDPDADRSSFAVRDRNSEWVVLKANDVWSLFTWYALSQRSHIPQGLSVIKTWVTTDLIKEIAQDARFGLRVFEPAVGFNKIAEVALKEIVLPKLAEKRGIDLNRLIQIKPLTLDALVETTGLPSRNAVIQEINSILREFLLFGAEESNGISPGGHILEKDGATAVVIFHEIAAFVKYINQHKYDQDDPYLKNDTYLQEYFEKFNGRNLTLYELLNRVYLEYSYHATENIPLMFEGLAGNREKAGILEEITGLAQSANENRGTSGVVKIANREVASALSGDEYTSTEYVEFKEPGYKFNFTDGNWIAVRPSGTEPYIRFYGELRVAGSGLTWGNIEEKKREADAEVKNLVLAAQNLLKANKLMKGLIQADTVVYNYATGFSKFAKEVKSVNGALIVGANAIFENAGAVSVLRAIKEAQPNFQIVVWAMDEDGVERLRRMGVETIADSISLETMDEIFRQLTNQGISSDKRALIVSQQDIENIKATHNGIADMSRFGVKTIVLSEQTVSEGNIRINLMPIVFARAITAISPEELKTHYDEFLKENLEGNVISQEDYAALSAVTEEVFAIPLVKVNKEKEEEIAHAQITYTETAKGN